MMFRANAQSSLFFLVLFCFKSSSNSTHYNGSDSRMTQNNTETEEDDSSFKLPVFRNHYTRTTLVIFFVLVAILSILSNSLIIYVVKANHHLHISINFLIVNMACGDFMATVVAFPLSIYYMYHGHQWMIPGDIGLFMCQLRRYLFFVPLFCSIFSLVAITFDRFQAVIYPIAYTQGNKWNKTTIFVIWLASLILPLHNAITNVVIRHHNGEDFCLTNESMPDALFIIILGYAVPHVIMTVLYFLIAFKLYKRRVPGERNPSNTNHQNSAKQTACKVTRMIICILMAFELCWAPVFFLYIGPSLRNTLFKYVGKIEGAMISKILMMFNGVSNAMIYAVYNVNFRRAFKAVVYNETVAMSLKKISLMSNSRRVWDKSGSSSIDTSHRLAKANPVTIMKFQPLDEISKCSNAP